MRKLIRRISIVIAATMIALTSAQARTEKILPMTVDFVGDWCFAGLDKNEANYRLPSWQLHTSEGCTKILSIGKWGFSGEGWLYFDYWSCFPIRMQLSQSSAPSGTTYIAMMTARCQPSGMEIAKGVLKTFEFSRYKGNLYITLN
jgi:hypothetical protein